MTTLDTLISSNAGFGDVIKAIQSGSAYIDPKGRVLSKTELKPITGYSNTYSIRGVEYAYNEDGQMIEIPREPLQLYKFDVAGDGKFTVPKLRNEKEGGYFSDITLNATKSDKGYTVENTEKSASGQYFKPLKGTDFSNQQWVGMSRGLSNINSAVQSGEATVDTKKSIERWDDGQGNEGSKEYYALRDGNGREVGALFDVPGRSDIKYADVGNETAGGGHYVFLQTDPKTGRVAPIQNFESQVTYRPSGGKTFWQQQTEAAKAFAPYAALIFGGPLAAELGGGLLGAAASSAIFQTAAGVPIEKMAENIATSTLTAGALGASGADIAGMAGGGVTGTMAANTAANLLQGNTVEEALTNAAISTAISTGANTIAQGQADDYIQNLPIPDYLDAGPAPTSEDVIAAFPETNPNLVETTLPNLTPDQIDAALSNLTGGYTLGGTTEGISATLPTTMVTGTEPIDYTLNVLTGGEGLTTPTSPNLDIMGGGQGLTGNLTGGVVGEGGLTPTGNVTLGDPTSYINTGAPVTTNKTYTYDDGSTLTVDKDGTPIDYTEATDTPYEGPVETPSSPLTRSQIEGLIKLGLGIYGASRVSDVVRDAISSGGDTETPQSGFPFTPSDISGWARPEYTKTWQAPIDINSLFTTDNLLGGTQWAGLQGNQFANTPQVSMSDFISSIQNGKV